MLHLNDDDTVLYLIWSHQDGYAMRHGGAWVPVDPEPDDSPAWAGYIVYVTREAVELFDAFQASGEPAHLSDFSMYVMPDID